MSAHGYSAYTQGCRCDVCRKAKADYMRERRARARAVAQRYSNAGAGLRADRVGSVRYVARIDRHGTRAGYEEHGCRCLECTDARSESAARYRRRSAS